MKGPFRQDLARRCLLPFALALPACLVGCGGGGQQAASTTTTAPTKSAPAVTTQGTRTSTPGALLGEAASAAQGDIPDNQTFVLFKGRSFSMKVPEGWPQTGAGGRITFRDKNNIARVVVEAGPRPTVASVTRELQNLHGAHVELPPEAIAIGDVPTVKVVYSTRSAPNPVTGKSVALVVDRYELAKGGKRAIVDLGTPVGVDNVDAYRLMIHSFRLQ